MKIEYGHYYGGPIRQYGHELGFTSFSQVSRGIYRALVGWELLGGFVPLDYFDEEVPYQGATCPIAINTGMPSGVVHAKTFGSHEHRWLLLAPNSDKVPENFHNWIPELVTALLAPSSWAKATLSRLFPEMPVYLVRHGVLPEYYPDPEARARRRSEYASGLFKVVHLTSTNAERKGTKLLIEAWGELERTGYAGADLFVVCRYDGYNEVMLWVAKTGAQSIHVVPSDGADYETTRRFYSSAHVLCQPSRAEGFGLCPLEAKACGVPVVMTTITGHSDHAALGAMVPITTGEPAPLDDMPGARAPALEPKDIQTALSRAREAWPALDAVATRWAGRISHEWAWEHQSGRAIAATINSIGIRSEP